MTTFLLDTGVTPHGLSVSVTRLDGEPITEQDVHVLQFVLSPVVRVTSYQTLDGTTVEVDDDHEVRG